MHQNSDYQPSSVKQFSQPSVKELVLKPIPQVSAYLIELQRLFKVCHGENRVGGEEAKHSACEPISLCSRTSPALHNYNYLSMTMAV